MSRLHAQIQRAELARQHAAIVAKALSEASPEERAYVASPGGDPLQLRGIPAIGRSVAGCIRGTDPERAVLRGAERPPLTLEERAAWYDRKSEKARRRASVRRHRDRVIERDAAKCHVCGKICERSEIHMDHVIALKDGGSDDLDNIAVACAPCSVLKDSGVGRYRPRP